MTSIGIWATVGRGICPDDDNAMVQAHGHVPLKAHGKTFLREVPGRMRRHHCDERPPRPARRAGPFPVGEPEAVKKVVVKVPVG